MSGVAIVAIPAQDDYVWKISSEKVPHLTILFLGDNPANLDKIVGFTEHAASTMLSKFGAEVERRGLLGPDDADVLFFRDGWSMKRIAEFRAALLKEPNISAAYNAAPQFDGWTPHLTLGFPATPAKPDKRDFPINWVNFDTLAVWTGDSSGPSFDLKEDMMTDVAWGASMEEFFAHHGIKGMKWGVRRKNPSGPNPVVISNKPRGGVKAKGGEGHAPHPDAIAAAIGNRKAKKSTVSALSNEELQKVVTRLNLEQQFNRLSTKPKTAGQKFIEEELKKIGREQVGKLAAQAVKLGAKVAV